MALKAIKELVKNRLPFWSADWDTVTEDFITEQYYFLQTYTGFSVTDVETEAKYTGTLRLLVTSLTAFSLVKRKYIQGVGGVNGGAATGAKHIKSAKADVVEAEFEYAKSKDGNAMIIDTESLLQELKSEICQYASVLLYRLPMCNVKTKTPLGFKHYTRNVITGDFE